MNKVSELDQFIYKRIRSNVTNFMSDTSRLYDKKDHYVLDIAPQDHNGAKEFYKLANVYTADIDPKSSADYIVDITKNNSDTVPSNFFDIVICTEVLEHTLNPFNAIAEISRVLKVGGLLLMTTPYNFRIHGPLPDCWRFTEHGIKALLAEHFMIEKLISDDDENRFLMPFQYMTIARKI